MDIESESGRSVGVLEVGMKFYILEPEVAGGWGPSTKFTRTRGKPVVVHELHYEFDGWLGDELLESTPVFIVTRRSADRLRAAKLTGMVVKPVKISKSEQFTDLYGDRELPEFVWIDIVGNAASDDFGMYKDGRLVVSKRALDALKKSQLDHCEIEELK
jgi:hypothetical protein